MVLKTDQENAIKALAAAVKAGFPEDLTGKATAQPRTRFNVCRDKCAR